MNNESIEYNKPRISEAAWLEIQTRELANATKAYDEEKKYRSRREFILLIVCLMTLLYTYPVKNFDNNPNIEIQAISLKIPLKDAIGVFPTLIVAIYLLFLSSAISQSIAMAQRIAYSQVLHDYKNSGKIENKYRGRITHLRSTRYLLLPTPLHTGSFTYGISSLPRTIVEIFVGTVFTAFPYFSTIFIIIISWNLLKYKILLIWNLICFSIMLLAFISSLISSINIKKVHFV